MTERHTERCMARQEGKSRDTFDVSTVSMCTLGGGPVGAGGGGGCAGCGGVAGPEPPNGAGAP